MCGFVQDEKEELEGGDEKDFKDENSEECMYFKERKPKTNKSDELKIVRIKFPKIKIPKEVKLKVQKDVIDLRKLQKKLGEKGVKSKWKPHLLL